MVEVGELTAELNLDSTGFSAGLESMSGALDGFKNTVAKVGDSLKMLMTNPIVLAAAAGAALVALGKAAYDAFVEIDAAYDAIEVGTGALGDELEGLKDSFDNVFANATYVSDAQTLAETISDLNTYLGLTGETLETVATQISNLQGMGMDVDVESLAQAFNRWGVDTEDMSAYLDYFYQVAQKTGTPISDLTSKLTSSQSTLSLFGFSLEESANLIGAMNKAGFDDIDSGLKILANSGVTTREAFDELIEKIRSAGSDSEALEAAGSAFGRNSVEMVNMIRSGMLDDLGTSFEDSAGAIEASAESTEDFGDKLNKVGREMTLFAAGAGQVLNDVLSALFDFVSWWFSLVGKLWEPFGKLFEKIGASFAKFWGESEDTTGDAVGNIAKLIEFLVNIVAAGVDIFLEYVYPVIEGVIWAIVQLVKLFSAIFAGDWEEAFTIVEKLTLAGMKLLYSILETGWNTIMDGLQFVAQSIINFIFDVVNSVADVIENGINMVIDALNSVARAANSMLGTDFELFQHVSLDIAAPTVPQIERFSGTALGTKMQESIKIYEDNLAAKTEKNGDKTVNVTQNVTINGDVQNDSQLYHKLNKENRNLGSMVSL